MTAPKAKSHRQLLLAPATVAALKAHLSRQRQERLALGPDVDRQRLRFRRRSSASSTTRNASLKMFDDAIRTVGVVPKIRLHDTRHTMATLALEAGVHPKVVQEQLGHSSIAVTMDTYSHVPQAVKRDSADKIAGLFGG